MNKERNDPIHSLKDHTGFRLEGGGDRSLRPAELSQVTLSTMLIAQTRVKLDRLEGQLRVGVM